MWHDIGDGPNVSAIQRVHCIPLSLFSSAEIDVCLPLVVYYPVGNTTIELCTNINGSTAKDVDLILTKQSPMTGKSERFSSYACIALIREC